MKIEFNVEGPVSEDALLFQDELVDRKVETSYEEFIFLKESSFDWKKSEEALVIKSQADLDRWYNGTISNTNAVCRIANSYNSNTTSVSTLIRAWNNYVQFVGTLPDEISYPDTSSNRAKVRTIRNKEQEIKNCFNRGDNVTYNNFIRELTAFERIGADLENSRNRFENSPSQTYNLARIENLMQSLVNQNNVLNNFSLVTSNRTNQAFNRHSDLIKRFQKVYFTDELDSLRQEYLTYKVKVPRRNEFINSLSGYSYSFSELNFGEYRYALLNRRMLNGLETIKGNLGRKTVVTSGYRNPRKQVVDIGGSATSQHCYGTGVDLRTNNSKKKWKEIASAACSAGADWVKPTTAPTFSYNHVHVDWRGSSVGSSYCNSFTTLEATEEGFDIPDFITEENFDAD